MKFGQVDDLDLVDFELPIIDEETKTILSNLKTSNNLKFYFGAPGWSDQKFKGLIYPPKTPAKNFLLEYSRQFNSIEVNATRYGIPKEKVLQKWYESVNETFKFSMKVPQIITHRKDINDYTAKIKMDEFLTAINILGNKSGVSFAVMAKYFDTSKFDDLEMFVNTWPNDTPLAIEFRNKSWFEKENIRKWQNLFFDKNIIPVITDTPGRRDVAHFNLVNNHLFVRYVGDFNHPSDFYRINLWTEKVREIISLGINNIWFYVHQPGENKEKILSFYNSMIPKMNHVLKTNIPLLKNYSIY